MTEQLQKASDNLYSFGSKILGNRVFDLYLKYRGIKMLTSTTLVPLALIMGKDAKIFLNINNLNSRQTI